MSGMEATENQATHDPLLRSTFQRVCAFVSRLAWNKSNIKVFFRSVPGDKKSRTGSSVVSPFCNPAKQRASCLTCPPLPPFVHA